MEEKVFIGAGSEYPLPGILCIPESDRPVPAVVLVHGSGPSDMDERVGKVTPFKDIAEGLAKNGIASLRYNKRSFEYGRKMVREKKVITVEEETIQDAISAAEMLKSDPRIDPQAVFLIGHSMGAMLAPRIDEEGGDFRGLILMAGTPYRLDRVMLRQMEEIIGNSGKLVSKLIGKQYHKMQELFAKIDEVSDEEAKKTSLGGGTTLYYFREMAEHPVEEALLKCDKPMLIMQGELDVQARAAIDFKEYERILSGRENVRFMLYPGLNHAFVEAVSGKNTAGSKEYSTERHIPDEVIRDIADWIMQQ